jgi:hypothetical protein
MAAAVLTDPRFARIWINATAPGVPATAVGGVPAASKFCAINSKAFNQSLATGTAVVPDCADPLKVSIIKRTAQSKDWSITGAGYFELAMRNDLQKIMDNGVSVGVVFEIVDDLIPPVNSGYYAGKAFLSTYNIVANNTDSYITVDVTFEADGEAVWTNAP